jgi:hypothetical protein
MPLKINGKLVNKYAYFSFQHGARRIKKLKKYNKLGMNGMTINENCALRDGNQRSELFDSPIPFLEFVWGSSNKGLKV